jgi:hypothetical protein
MEKKISIWFVHEAWTGGVDHAWRGPRPVPGWGGSGNATTTDPQTGYSDASIKRVTAKNAIEYACRDLGGARAGR